MPPKRNINIKNPYNPMSSLYKKLTKLWAGPLVTTTSPKSFEIGKRNIDKYKERIRTASGQEFQRNDIKHPAYYLYMDTYINAMRNERYLEFDQMELHPDCASVLETYADEITCYSELNPPIKIVSNNLDIKECLNEFFYTTLNMPKNLYSLVYSLLKQGDLFLYCQIDEVLGITNIIPIPAGEVERLEGQDESNPNYVQFQWNRAGQTYEYGWNMVHFRLLGSDKFYPYGTSIFDAARRAYHQLCLLENAVIGYRVVRSPERRVFYVDVGGINDEEIPLFIEEIKKNLKQSVITNPASGQAEKRWNPISVEEDYVVGVRGQNSGTRIDTLQGGSYPVRQDSLIPLLDGRIVTIKELAEEYINGKENWVYSVIDDLNQKDLIGKVVPGKVVWCGKNYHCNNMLRVWLDNSTYIDVAPEHPFVMRDGSSKRADQLNENDSLMPFRAKKSIKKKINGYWMIDDPNSGKWKFVHSIISEEINNKQKAIERSGEKTIITHHVDFNKLNNNPNNLKYMGVKEHLKYHNENINEILKTEGNALKKWINSEENINRLIEWNKSEDGRELTIKRNKNRWKDSNFRFNHSGKNHFLYKKFALLYAEYSLEDLKEFCIKNKINNMKDYIKLSDAKFKSRGLVRSYLEYHKIKSWREFANKYLGGYKRNHKVLQIEKLIESDDVYCMTIVGPNNEQDRHNFAIIGKTENNEYNPDIMDGVIVKNTGDIEDLKHMRDKLFTSLGVPSAYFSQDSSEDRQSLAQKDIKFGKRILRLQNHVIAGLTELAITHLYILGFRDEDLVNFEIKLNNPSRIAEMQELEQMRTRLDLANSAGDFFSTETIYKKFLGLSDDEIKKERIKKYADAKYDLSLQQFEDTGEGGAALGGDLGGGGFDSPIEGLSDVPEDENPFSQPPEGSEAADEDSVLLSEPSGSDIENLSTDTQKKLDDDEYLTPGAKGHAYSRATVDKRFAGARKRHNSAESPISFSRSTRKNLFGSGFDALRSLSKGIVREDILTEDNELSTEDLYSLNETLINENEQRDEKDET